MEKLVRPFIGLLCIGLFAGCVTQNYENDKDTPVVQNESTNNEIAMTRISLGLGYLKMGNTAQAKLNLEKAKRFAPNLVQVYTAFAHYYDSVGEPELAITAYEKALSLKSDDADTLNNYGVFLCKQKRYQEAEKQILKAIAVPTYILVAQSYENLALCQLQANAFKKAETYFEKAILHSPSNASSLLHMVRLQYAMGDFKNAQVFLKRYEKATRRFSPNALALAYKVYEKQYNKKIAKNYGSMLVKMFPNSYESKQYLLNSLQEIEADVLAQKYRDSLVSDVASKPKKRVVKLSPKVTMAPSAKIVKNKPLTQSKLQSSTKTNEASNNMVPASALEQDELTKAKLRKASMLAAENEGNSKLNKKPLVASNEQSLVEKKSADVNKYSNQSADTEQKMVTLPVHVVEEGDSLFSISKKYNIHMKAIERWNGFDRSNVLKIGDVIYLANPKKMTKL